MQQQQWQMGGEAGTGWSNCTGDGLPQGVGVHRRLKVFTSWPSTGKWIEQHYFQE